MKQVVVIHGGTTFSTYEKYLTHLSTATVRVERMRYQPKWKERLQQHLGNNYDVLLPSMPNKTNAVYDEWKIYFDRVVSVLSDNCVLVGHSLGAVFLVKYLSENQVPIRIAATILIGAPFSDERAEDLTNFAISTITNLFADQAGNVTFFVGTDDPVIDMVEYERYKTTLPHVQYRLLSAPDHFVREELPELIETIRQY